MTISSKLSISQMMTAKVVVVGRRPHLTLSPIGRRGVHVGAEFVLPSAHHCSQTHPPRVRAIDFAPELSRRCLTVSSFIIACSFFHCLRSVVRQVGMSGFSGIRRDCAFLLYIERSLSLLVISDQAASPSSTQPLTFAASASLRICGLVTVRARKKEQTARLVVNRAILSYDSLARFFNKPLLQAESLLPASGMAVAVRISDSLPKSVAATNAKPQTDKLLGNGDRYSQLYLVADNALRRVQPDCRSGRVLPG